VQHAVESQAAGLKSTRLPCFVEASTSTYQI
jgi:hypothetical protein